MHVRRVRAGEGARLRELRLRALRDAPAAFASTAAREAAFPPQEWERRAAEGEAGATAVTLVAEDGQRWLGTLTGRRGDGPAVQVYGMWVDPSARRCGAGRALLDALAAWARAGGATRLELSVTDRAPARRRSTAAPASRRPGRSGRFPGDPPRVERLLRRSLTPG